MKRLALALLVAACQPPPTHTVTTAPKVAPKEAPADSAGEKPSVQCDPTNAQLVKRVGQTILELSEGARSASEAEVMRGMAQALVTVGMKIDREDLASLTITTQPFTGQSIDWSCGVIETRSYSLNFAVVGPSVSVGMECWVRLGPNPNSLGEARECGAAGMDYMTKDDATIAKSIVGLASDMIELRKMQQH